MNRIRVTYVDGGFEDFDTEEGFDDFVDVDTDGTININENVIINMNDVRSLKFSELAGPAAKRPVLG